MNRNLIMGVAVLFAVGGAIALFPKGDLDIDVPDAEPVERETTERIEHVPDDGSSSTAQASTDEKDDGSYREGSSSENEPFLHPAQIQANKAKQQPFPQWSNKARPAWKAIDYRLRQLGDTDNAAIAIEVANVLAGTNRQVDPDIGPLVTAQTDALAKLKVSPNADEIDSLLARVEDLLDELQKLPPPDMD